MVTMAFYAAVFLSAFLLFVIQPMLTKILLPDFGGSYLVWGSAMVFFQAVLLAGYVFGHAAQRRAGVQRYARWHGLLLLMPFAFFPFRFEAGAAVAASLPLAPAVFWRLLLLISGPFLVLSMTSLVLQRWLMISPVRSRSNPYVLYSASNAGSVLALLAYPVLIEPYFSLAAQGMLWWAGYAVLVLLHAICYPWRPEPAAADAPSAHGGTAPASRYRWLTWFMLSFGACAVLLAVTNMMTFDLAAVPMLWVLPLAVYLLAFVLTFKQRIWFPRWMEAGMNWAVVAAALFYLLLQLGLTVPPAPVLLLHLLVLFVLCMNASARLVRTRPEGEEELTGFYVALAAGGLGGSLLISWGVPLASTTLVEYLIAPALLLVACGLAEGSGTSGVTEGCRLKTEGNGKSRKLKGERRNSSNAQHPTPNIQRPTLRQSACRQGVLTVGLMLLVVLLPLVLGGFRLGATLIFAMAALPVALLLRSAARRPMAAALLLVVLACGTGTWRRFSTGSTHVAAHRNFYGIYTIFDRDGQRYLQHGTTLHGRQYLDAARSATPVGYYHPSTPAAGVMTRWQPRLRDIGMVGLGTGALAAYAGEGARLTIYELDPDNHTLAERFFTYLEQSRQRGVQLDFVYGDGRVALRERSAGSLDLLIIDAFNSGSIPVHLLTTEAMEGYFRVLREDGLLLLHISNRVLDLAPVIYANAAVLGLHACEQSNAGAVDPDADETYWMALGRHPATVNALKKELFWYGRRESGWLGTPPWTDGYSPLSGAIRWLQ